MGYICDRLQSTFKSDLKRKPSANNNQLNGIWYKKRRVLINESNNNDNSNGFIKFLYNLWTYNEISSLQCKTAQQNHSTTAITFTNVETLSNPISGSGDENEFSLAYKQQQVHSTQTFEEKYCCKHKSSHKIRKPLIASNLSSSYSSFLVRQSICLYAASSVILALCYFATPSSAAEAHPSHPV